MLSASERLKNREKKIATAQGKKRQERKGPVAFEGKHLFRKLGVKAAWNFPGT